MAYKPGQKVPISGIWKPTAGGTPVAVSNGEVPTDQARNWLDPKDASKAREEVREASG